MVVEMEVRLRAFDWIRTGGIRQVAQRTGRSAGLEKQRCDWFVEGETGFVTCFEETWSWCARVDSYTWQGWTSCCGLFTLNGHGLPLEVP